MSSVALVTGASSGIGEVFARKLSGMGYKLLLVARRKERLEKLAAQLQNAEVLTADLTLESDLCRIEDRASAEPELEFLVNNAGFGVSGAFHETSWNLRTGCTACTSMPSSVSRMRHCRK